MPNWRLAISVAKFDAAESDIGLPWIPLVQQLAPTWARNARVPLWDDATRTVGELFQSVVSALNLMQKSDGTKVESAREWRLRATTRYSFREGWLKNSFLGASYIWSSENVVGFRQVAAPNDYPALGIGGTVLVSDIAMPGQDGYDLIRWVRSLDAPQTARNIPAVAVTAFVRSEDREKALAAGFAEHVPKPVEMSKLIDVVARLGALES